MPEMAIDPKRKVVMPPITHVGVLAKKAPICKSDSMLSPQGLLNSLTSQCMRAMRDSVSHACSWEKVKQSSNAPKQMEIVTAKHTTKHKHRDKSQFTSLLITLDNSGAKSQRHQAVQHKTHEQCKFVQCGEGGVGAGGGGGGSGDNQAHCAV